LIHVTATLISGGFFWARARSAANAIAPYFLVGMNREIYVEANRLYFASKFWFTQQKSAVMLINR
jgi:hypothetical protein